MTEPKKKIYIHCHGVIIKRDNTNDKFEVPPNIVFKTSIE